MPVLDTLRFGALEYDPAGVIEFPCGLPGFDRERHFIVVEQAALAPLIFLQSVDSPKLCFPAVPVSTVDPGYQLEVTREDLEILNLDPERQPVAGEEVACLAIVAVENGSPSANLLAPVVIHSSRRIGVQAVRTDSRYPHRHPLVAPCS